MNLINVIRGSEKKPSYFIVVNPHFLTVKLFPVQQVQYI